MNLYILRHGQTDYNLNGKFQGQIDIPLNKTGVMQVKEICKILSNINFDIVFSSPLKRAIETAEIITNQNILIENRLIERSFGLLEGKSSISDYEEKIEEYKIESIYSLQERVFSFMDELMGKYSNYNNILIATHACVARMIECYINHLEYFEVNKTYELLNGSYKLYEIDEREYNEYRRNRENRVTEN